MEVSARENKAKQRSTQQCKINFNPDFSLDLHYLLEDSRSAGESLGHPRSRTEHSVTGTRAHLMARTVPEECSF